MTTDDAAEKPPEGREVPVEWYVPENVLSGYATNMTLQRTEHEFILSFYEQRIPIVFDSQAQIDHVRATCFARVTIAAARFPGFMDVLQQALKNFQGDAS